MAFYDTLDGSRNSWCNMRIESLIVDGDITFSPGSISVSSIESGTESQVIKTVAGETTWANISLDEITGANPNELIVSDGSGNLTSVSSIGPANITSGPNNTFLNTNGSGIVGWVPVSSGSIGVFQAYAPGTQRIDNVTDLTRVIIDPPNINTLGATTSANALVVPSDGVYEASINLCLTSAFSGCYVWIDYNPGGGFGSRLAQTSTSAGLTSNQGWSQVSCLIDCVAGGLIRFTWQRNYLLSGANNFILPISHVMVKKLS